MDGWPDLCRAVADAARLDFIVASSQLNFDQIDERLVHDRHFSNNNANALE